MAPVRIKRQFAPVEETDFSERGLKQDSRFGGNALAIYWLSSKKIA